MSDSTYIIAGCGVFGLSTAYHLVKQGVNPSNIQMMDVHAVPSPWSAAADFNKIIRCEYHKDIYTKLAIESLHQWRDIPLFSQTFNECGRLLATPLSHQGRIEYEKIGISNLEKYGEGSLYEYWQGGQQLRNVANMATFGKASKNLTAFIDNNVPPGKEIKWNPESGLGRSGESLTDLFNWLKDKGVKFKFGNEGKVIFTEKNNDLNGANRCLVTASGERLNADYILLALGANTGNVINLQNQQSATGLFVTHIQLNDVEFEKYKNLPVVFDAEMGYFFPPDPKSKILKICLAGGGIKRLTNDPFVKGSKLSLPRYHNDHPTDTIPVERAIEVSKILEQYTPELKNHNLFNSKICWIGDAQESHFIIDKIPDCSNIWVATGDSGHGYKFLPNIGKYIIARMNNTLGDISLLGDNEYGCKLADAWAWKDNTHSEAVDPAKTKWRVGKSTQDISEINFLQEGDQGVLISKI